MVAYMDPASMTGVVRISISRHLVVFHPRTAPCRPLIYVRPFGMGGLELGIYTTYKVLCIICTLQNTDG